MDNTPRQTWIAPQIQRYGTFEQRTQAFGCDKDFGGSDGFTFQGQSVICAS